MVDHGLVHRLDAGNVSLYSLNGEHLLAPAVSQMTNANAELIRRMREQIATWTIAPIHASLFGSAARGDGDSASDIDILIVRPLPVETDDTKWRAQIDEMADLILRWSGNQAGIAEISEDELPRLREERAAIVRQVQEDAVDLAGQLARRMFSTITAR
jgi:predicted nucleotidyltransferase